LEIAVVAEDPRREHEETRVSHEFLTMEDLSDHLDVRVLGNDHFAGLEAVRETRGKEKDAREEHDPDDSAQNQRAADPVTAPHKLPSGSAARGRGRSSQRWRITAAAAAWSARSLAGRRNSVSSPASRVLRLSSIR